jgi:hypothetical protein
MRKIVGGLVLTPAWAAPGAKGAAGLIVRFRYPS